MVNRNEFEIGVGGHLRNACQHVEEQGRPCWKNAGAEPPHKLSSQQRTWVRALQKQGKDHAGTVTDEDSDGGALTK